MKKFWVACLILFVILYVLGAKCKIGTGQMKKAPSGESISITLD